MNLTTNSQCRTDYKPFEKVHRFHRSIHLTNINAIHNSQTHHLLAHANLKN